MKTNHYTIKFINNFSIMILKMNNIEHINKIKKN